MTSNCTGFGSARHCRSRGIVASRYLATAYRTRFESSNDYWDARISLRSPDPDISLSTRFGGPMSLSIESNASDFQSLQERGHDFVRELPDFEFFLPVL